MLLTNGESGVFRSGRACLPLVCVYICLDALGIGLLNNVLRAASKVTVPALINLLAFYVVGLPLAGLLAFGLPELAIGLPALWVGLSLILVSDLTRPNRLMYYSYSMRYDLNTIITYMLCVLAGGAGCRDGDDVCRARPLFPPVGLGRGVQTGAGIGF